MVMTSIGGGYSDVSLVGAGLLTHLKQDEAVAIVDPYSSGRLLIDELCQRGCPIVAVRSSLDVHKGLLETWNPVPFERVIVHHGNVAETVEALQKGKPLKAIIAGSQPGVQLADELAELLSLRGNDSKLRPCRVSRHLMHKQLEECALASCKARRITSEKDLELECGADIDISDSRPRVVHPCNSNGIDRVYLCESSVALREAVHTVLALNEVDGVLVEDFVEGPEYLVDCVSFNGRHLVSAMWLNERNRQPGAMMHDCTKTEPCSNGNGSVHEVIREYVFSCITAMGVSNGPSHSKVIFNELRGPCLINMGAHMHGSVGPVLWKLCAGVKQAQPFLVADVFAGDGAEVSRRIDAVAKGELAYELSMFSSQVVLRCAKSGILDRSINQAAGAWIRKLPTFWSSRFLVEEGDKIEPTRDMANSPGFVILVGASAADVERDALAIREAERDGTVYIFNKLSGILPPDSKKEIVIEGAASRASSKESASVIAAKDRPVLLSTSRRLRELEVQVSAALSPLVSPAQSPLLSPLGAPINPPGEDLEELDLDGDVCFSLDGLTQDELPPLDLDDF